MSDSARAGTISREACLRAMNPEIIATRALPNASGTLVLFSWLRLNGMVVRFYPGGSWDISSVWRVCHGTVDTGYRFGDDHIPYGGNDPRRRGRSTEAFFAGATFALHRDLKVELIGMEACGGSDFVGRGLREQGHQVRLIPAQYVKPYVKTKKSDYIDAEVIAEASGTTQDAVCSY